MGAESLEKIIRERREERRRAILEAERFAKCVKERLGEVTVILYGSYARGDFNEWSDIDVLVVAERDLPRSPLERLNLVEECLEQAPGIDPVIVTKRELQKLVEKRNPVAEEALSHGITLVDDLKLAKQFQ